MFVFGVAVTDVGKYESIALPGIERAAEPDSLILTRSGYDSIRLAYNELMDEAADVPALEGLILLHQDVELTDESPIPRIRPLLSDPTVGLVGALGWAAPGAPPVIDHDGSVEPQEAPGFRSSEMDGQMGGRPRDRFGRTSVHHSAGSHEVELADGVLMAIPTWVVRALRFDLRLGDFHGYDLDFSMRVRAAGGRVVCNDIPHVHHMSRLWRDRAELVRDIALFAKSWDPDLRPPQWAPAFQR